MNREEFMDFLLTNGVVVVRLDRQGYNIVRNTLTGKMSGVPENDPIKAATVCRICKNLGLDELPENEHVREAKAIIDAAHEEHTAKRKQ